MDTKSYIVLNFGKKYELSDQIVNKICQLHSIASKQISSSLTKNKNIQEFYFQRHSECTDCIMDFFLGQTLHIPIGVCLEKFKEEITFWGIEESEIGSCCYSRYVSYYEDKETTQILERSEEKRNETREHIIQASTGTGWKSFRAKVWKVLEYPNSSVYGKVIFVISNVCVLLSIFVLVCETDPLFKRTLTEEEWIEYFTDDEEDYYGVGMDDTNTTFKERPEHVQVTMEFLQYIHWVLVAYFTIEMLFRVVFFPLNFKQFLGFLNIIDILALGVMYLRIISNEVDNKEKYKISFKDAIHSLQVFRVFRLFRLAKNTSGFRIMTAALKASATHLLLLSLCMFATVLIFSALGYFSRDASFPSIPVASWWAIVTLTTVGYGDIVPQSTFGKVIGSACAVTGVCLLAILIPVLVNNFLLFHTHCRVLERKRLKTKDIMHVKTASIYPKNDNE